MRFRFRILAALGFHYGHHPPDTVVALLYGRYQDTSAVHAVLHLTRGMTEYANESAPLAAWLVGRGCLGTGIATESIRVYL